MAWARGPIAAGSSDDVLVLGRRPPEHPTVAHMRQWWHRVRPALYLPGHVKLIPVGHTGKQRVEIKHPTRDFSLTGQGRYLVTTSWYPLDERQFDRRDIEIIEAADNRERGRAIWCYDLRLHEVMAAVAYHIDWKKVPPLIQTFALRQEDERRTASVRCAILLKAYVHVIGAKIEERTEVDFDAEGAFEAFAYTYLGFAQRSPRDDAAKPQRGVAVRQYESLKPTP